MSVTDYIVFNFFIMTAIQLGCQLDALRLFVQAINLLQVLTFYLSFRKVNKQFGCLSYN